MPRGSKLAAVFLSAAGTPSILWCLAAATAVAIHNATLTGSQLYWAERALSAFLILSISLVVASVLVRLIGLYGERNSLPFAVAGLSRTLVYVLVLSIGALILLRIFGLEITPLLTALGVGGLAVALALQDTLANLFAGIHILVEQPLMVGDMIRLSTNEEGVVKDIGWRTTRVLNGTNSMIVIPNTKITSGILINFSAPSARVSADIPILVAHHADPDQVIRIAMDVAHKTPGILSDPSPCVFLDPGVLLSHMEFKLNVHLPSHQESGPIKSALRLGLLQSFRSAEIPFAGGGQIAIVKSE